MLLEKSKNKSWILGFLFVHDMDRALRYLIIYVNKPYAIEKRILAFNYVHVMMVLFLHSFNGSAAFGEMHFSSDWEFC